MLALFGVIGVLNGLFLSVYLLFFRSKKNPADKYLGLLLLSISIRMGKSIFFQAASLSFLTINVGLAAFTCVGPFLLFYLKYSAFPDYKFRWINTLHFIPALFVLSGSFTPYPQEHPVWDLRYDLIMIQILYYIVLSFIFYKRNIRQFKNLPYNKNWYLFLLLAVSGIWAAYGAVWWFNVLPYLSGTLLFCLVIYVMLFIWLNRNKPLVPEKLEKYKNSKLSKEESKFYLEKITMLMENNRPYLNNDLTLSKLASQLEIPPHLLSQVINENLNLNFFEFINFYRIKEVKLRLASPELSQFTIAAIAYDCGFNSISSFNTAFKKAENMSPSEYRSKYVS